MPHALTTRSFAPVTCLNLLLLLQRCQNGSALAESLVAEGDHTGGTSAGGVNAGRQLFDHYRSFQSVQFVADPVSAELSFRTQVQNRQPADRKQDTTCRDRVEILSKGFHLHSRPTAAISPSVEFACQGVSTAVNEQTEQGTYTQYVQSSVLVLSRTLFHSNKQPRDSAQWRRIKPKAIKIVQLRRIHGGIISRNQLANPSLVKGMETKSELVIGSRK